MTRSPVRLLVVDDNAAIHSDFRKVLCPADAGGPSEAARGLFGEPEPVRPLPRFEIDSAHQGEEALGLAKTALAAGRPYALAFVDVRMPPGWDGVRTIREMWKVDPRLHCVVCTAYTDLSWEDLRGELEHDDRLLVLKKPFDAIEVRQMAAALAAKWRLEREREESVRDLEARVHAAVGERLRLEEGLRRTQRLDALGRLTASLGHEINNPLVYVLGNVELALGLICQDEVDVGHLIEARAMLRESLEGARRVRDLLARIRSSSPAAEGVAQAIDIGPVVTQALDLVGTELHHRARVSVDLMPSPLAVADARQLEQVLMNVLLNAAQALPDRDRALNHVTVRVARDGDRIRLEIEDNGCGIAPGHLEQVFEPFFTTRPVGEGTGLGLAVSRQIVSNLGGEISISSRPGLGTTVRVWLRAPVGQQVSVSRAPSGSPATSRILIIDDDPMVGRVIGRALKGHFIETASNGNDGIKSYEERPFDLVICDMMMAGMSGMDVHAALARLGAQHARRMFFVTGGVFTPGASAFLAQTDNPCVEKPFDLKILRRLVDDRIDALAALPAA